MYYATDNSVTTADKSNDPTWIEITIQQYAEALAGIQAGKVVTIENGFAVIDPPKPEPEPEPEPEPQYKTQFSVLEFRGRFTIDEQLAIRQAQMTDMEVGLVYDNFQAAQFIDIEDPRVEAGIDLYIAKGLLDPERKLELLETELIEQ